jgi:hypothetical protein
MILDLQLEKKNGKIKNTLSHYQPSGEVKERILMILRDFNACNQTRTKPYREFNDCSLIDRMNNDQMSWLQYVEPPSLDPDEYWKSRAFRPIVRNKIITIAAHITAAVIFPLIYAQNENDEEDRDAAAVMRDIMEWCNEQADYDKTFMSSVIAALVNPAAFIYTEYAERFRFERKPGQKDSDVKRVLDEMSSGIRDFIVPCDEVWIRDIYEPDIQKQPVLMWRRVIDYSQAKKKYQGNEQFDNYVRPGLQLLMGDDALFYQTYDKTQLDTLVEEIIAWYPSDDLMLTLVNGVLISDPNTPNPRKDKKIPFVKMGYELIDEGRFFYYKSLAFKLAPDEEVVNTAYRMVADGTYLSVMPPSVVFGNEMIDNSVIVPGVITTIDNSTNPNASFQTLNTNNNLTAGYNLIEKVEASMSESSSDVLQSGQAPAGDTTAFEVSRLEQNARVMLGLFGKMVGFAVRDWGRLRISDICQYMTVGEATQTLNGATAMKFRNFLIPDKKQDGKSISHKIEFDMELPNEVTEDELMGLSRETQKREKKVDNNMKLFRVNPELFRKLNFMVKVKAEALMPKSDALEKAMMLEEYAQAMANPLINQRAVTRDLLLGAYQKTADDPDKYMMDEQQMQMQAQQAAAQEQPGVSPNVMKQAGRESGLSTMVR